MKDGKNQKLTDSEVSRIKQELSKGTKTQQELGEKYGVSQSTISDINTGDTHTNVK